METQGRSPLKDVVRSVVISAGMISPALLGACRNHEEPTPPPTPPGVGTDGGAGMATGQVPGQNPPTVPQAPPPELVRPRTPPGTVGGAMPTRGFSGGAHARR